MTKKKKKKPARMTLDMPDWMDRQMNEMTGRHDRTKSEILRRAFSLYVHLDRRREEGDVLAVVREDGEVFKLVGWEL